MKDWKIRQEIYHRLKTNYDDDLKTKDIVISSNIIDNAVRYFNEKNVGWIYPAKSYMVAICYSRWLSEIFGGYPLEYLDDPDLLYRNDPYFVRYSKDEYNYIKILCKIDGWEFNNEIGMVPDVKQYFDEEFMIGQI
jgi:hypothetical protein